MISIIIPVWNDADALSEALGRVRATGGCGVAFEVIVADASTTDDSAAVARAAGARVVKCDRPSRGRQMNAGAAAATGDVLLFQHTDTELTADHLRAIEATLAADACVIGGAFHRKFDPRHKSRQWLVPVVRRWQAWRKNVYGDQSIFCRRDAFEAMGGYAEIALMEDVDFSSRLRRAARRARGRVALLDPPMLSSARRHRKHGKLSVTLENVAMIWMFKLGVRPDTLHRWYYRKARRAVAAGETSALGAPEISG
jgi:rSAM/selenodomain-associated transferase 2